MPQGLYNECRRGYLCDVHVKIKKHNIPPELVLNADQTPSSYISIGKSTMATRGEKSVPIKGLTDKRNITSTFVVSLSGEFLPMQIIYTGHLYLDSVPEVVCCAHLPVCVSTTVFLRLLVLRR